MREEGGREGGSGKNTREVYSVGRNNDMFAYCRSGG